MNTIDLSGVWRYEEDLQNIGMESKLYNKRLEGQGFTLPGDACSNKIGRKYTPPAELCYEAVRTLRPEYEYIGALWLQREFELPEDWEGKNISLFLERVNIASDLWIDGEKIDRQIIEISTPHIYNLTGRVKSGIHTLTLRIDNSNLLNLDGMASGYSVDTQSIWNGIIGAIELRCEEIFHLSDIQIYTTDKGISIKTTVHSDCEKPDDRRNASIEIYAVTPDDKTLKKITYDFTIYNKKQPLHIDYPIRHPECWDEFNPSLYKLHLKLECMDITDEKEMLFGIRTVETKGTSFVINGKKTALRGTLDCGIYPLTGYPPTDFDTWLKTFRTVKEYGLNHVRFHSWCPPDIAFTAADMVGVYILAEMPLWLNTDVCALATGDDPIHRKYFLEDAVNISRTYGNHPSFIMFSNGNELLGDFEMLEDITTMVKAFDPRRLYTLTSNFDRAISPADDYFSAFEAAGHRVRVQVFHDVVSEHTRLSYDEAVNDVDMPIVSFEVGQYCVYPDVDSVSDYTGNLKPVNFDFIHNEMIKHDVYHMLGEYKKASGNFAALMYKEEIEASLRTHGMGGFELLGLSDYTGQGTATIGLLDVFWNSKHIISAEQFRSFCNDVVPLMKADRIFMNTDFFAADLDLYDYSKRKISFPTFKFEVFDGDKKVFESESRSKRVTFPLDFVTRPTSLRCVLSVGEYTNQWNVYVYTDDVYEGQTEVLKSVGSRFEDIVQNGGKAIVMMDKYNMSNPIEGLFKPTFWSPAHFPSERTCGFIFDSASPVFEYFPTGDYADFQWKHPIDNCVCADVSELGREFRYMVEPVPNYYSNVRRSPMFEAKIGNGSFLFCGFDFSVQRPAVKALKSSIMRYVDSDSFKPQKELNIEWVKKLFK